jgi:hypothetical protein
LRAGSRVFVFRYTQWLQGCCGLQGLPRTSGSQLSKEALLLVYQTFVLNVAISVLMGGSLFAFHVYILIGKKMNTCTYILGLDVDVDVDLSFLPLFKCLIYDSSSRIFYFPFGMGFVCFCHWFHVCQVLDFITARSMGS